MKFLILALALASPLAHAAKDGDLPSSCEFTVNGEKADLTLTAGGNNAFSGKLLLGNTELTPVGNCFYQNVPGRRGLRCAFSDGNIRFEVYPFAMVNGAFKPLSVIVWTGGNAQDLQGTCQ